MSHSVVAPAAARRLTGDAVPSVESRPLSPSILRRPGLWVTLMTVVPLLVGSGYVIENWLGARELARVKAAVAAAGIELDPHRIPSSRPPDAENFCATPLLLALGNGVTSGPEYQSVERLSRWRSDSYGNRPALQSLSRPEPADWALIRDVLAVNDLKSGLTRGGPEPLAEISALLDRELASVMADLEAALPRPRSVLVPTSLDRLRGGQAAHDISLELTGLRNLFSVIELRVHVDLASGRPDRAATGILLLLRLAEGVEAHETALGAMVGGSARIQALAATWTAALSPEALSKERWLELAAAHRAGGSLERIPDILRGEMIFAHESGTLLRADRKRLWEWLGGYYTGGGTGVRWQQWLCEVIPPGWIDFNMARSLEGSLIMMQRFGDTADPKRFNREKQTDQAREWLAARSGLGHDTLAWHSFFMSSRIPAAVARFPFISRLGETACAL